MRGETAVNFSLVVLACATLGREASPTAVVIDSLSAKSVDIAGISGPDTGKKIKGRKRHIITDIEKDLVRLTVYMAGIQDRDGAVGTITPIRQLYP